MRGLRAGQFGGGGDGGNDCCVGWLDAGDAVFAPDGALVFFFLVAISLITLVQDGSGLSSCCCDWSANGAMGEKSLWFTPGATQSTAIGPDERIHSRESTEPCALSLSLSFSLLIFLSLNFSLAFFLPFIQLPALATHGCPNCH